VPQGGFQHLLPSLVAAGLRRGIRSPAAKARMALGTIRSAAQSPPPFRRMSRSARKRNTARSVT